MKAWTRDLRWMVPLSLLLGTGLGLLDGGIWWIGTLAYGLLLLLVFSMLTAAWRWVCSGQGQRSWRTLALLLGLAFFLRLGIGISLTYLLPATGYDNPAYQAGYLYSDSFDRDSQAWDLASSDLSLTIAFDKDYSHDQYGGLMALSASVYRFISPDFHRPWMIVILAAGIYALGTAFLWKTAGQVLGEKAALIGSWIFALYPETLFLGSAQMREPFLITFTAMAFWGLVDWQASRRRMAWSWIGGGLAGLLAFSPGVALFALVVLIGWFLFDQRGGRVSWRILLAAAGVFLIGLVLFFLAISRIETLGEGSILERIIQWFRYSVSWDVYQLKHLSGWVELLLDEIPESLHLPFVTGYGLAQPVLPAAIIEPAPWQVQTISVLRAAGWYSLAPLLIYGLVAAGRNREIRLRSLLLWLGLTMFAWLVICAVRAGGDQWDNPRYRAIFLFWQALLAGYALTWQRKQRDPWLVRFLAVEIVFLGFFTEWYIARYTGWTSGRLPFWVMVAAIVVLSGLILAGGWLRDLLRRRARRP